MTPCPGCGGRYLAGHPAGWLVWQHEMTCPLGEADDATRHADHLRVKPSARPITLTEIVLLTALGYQPTIDEVTHLTTVTRSVTHRCWPRLADLAMRAAT